MPFNFCDLQWKCQHINSLFMHDAYSSSGEDQCLKYLYYHKQIETIFIYYCVCLLSSIHIHFNLLESTTRMVRLFVFIFIYSHLQYNISTCKTRTESRLNVYLLKQQAKKSPSLLKKIDAVKMCLRLENILSILKV